MNSPIPQQAHGRLEAHGLRAVTEYLDGEGVRFEVVEHAETQTAAAESRAAHVDSAAMAKTVVVRDGHTWLLAVLPASRRVDLEKLRSALGIEDQLRLATEEEIAERFPQTDVGAVPPVGPTLVNGTVVDPQLLEHDEIVCSGGDHRHAIRLAPHDLVRLADARTADISRD